MKDVIIEKLSQVEQDHQVRILFALESGSRGWGFASQDSDYDVRFIYIHTEDHYLSIDKRRDVIEYPITDVLDVNGWDIKKALSLFYRSNPTLYEWLDSPIVYQERCNFRAQLSALLAEYFSPKACYHHYLSMLLNNYSDYASKSVIKMKKYFYVLRPLFACQWIQDKNSMPPMLFSDLLMARPKDQQLYTQLMILLEQKRQGREQDPKPRIEIIDQFIMDSISPLREYANSIQVPAQKNYVALNKLFRNMVREAWSCP